jgi:2-phosphosulfolactate phosphatase
MQIERADFVAGARTARGLVIVIDVFRACTLAAVALAAGARRIVPVAEIAAAKKLKAEHPDWLLLGERDARPLPGFEGGNSPSELVTRDLTGRSLIHTTHAGTQGLAAAYRWDGSSTSVIRVLTGALVNAAATARYARRACAAGVFDQVTLVAMGQSAVARCDEDDLCADYLSALLRREAFPIVDIPARLRRAPAAAKFFDPAATWAPEADFHQCVDTDSIDFAVGMAMADDGLPSLIRLATQGAA